MIASCAAKARRGLAASVAGGAALLAASALSAGAQTRPATCLAVIGGATKIDGRCTVERRPGGGFAMRTRGYLAAVDTAGRNVGEGYGQRLATDGASSVIQVIDPAGRLRRAGACWVNATSRLCVWPGRARRP